MDDLTDNKVRAWIVETVEEILPKDKRLAESTEPGQEGQRIVSWLSCSRAASLLFRIKVVLDHDTDIHSLSSYQDELELQVPELRIQRQEVTMNDLKSETRGRIRAFVKETLRHFDAASRSLLGCRKFRGENMYEPQDSESQSEEELKRAIGDAVLRFSRLIARLLRPIVWTLGMVLLVITIGSWIVGATWLVQALAVIGDWKWDWTGTGPTGP